MDTMERELTDDELCERDERIASEIRHVLEYKRNLARQMRNDASELESQARRIEQAAKAGRWWELDALLEPSDVESLCNTSPTNLLGD